MIKNIELLTSPEYRVKLSQSSAQKWTPRVGALL